MAAPAAPAAVVVTSSDQFREPVRAAGELDTINRLVISRARFLVTIAGWFEGASSHSPPSMPRGSAGLERRTGRRPPAASPLSRVEGVFSPFSKKNGFQIFRDLYKKTSMEWN